jgi:hypothetical protein
MKDTLVQEVSSVLAMLEGGPTTIPQALRTQTVTLYDEKVKLPYYGGYEHFERTSEYDDTFPQKVIYRWIRRTELAE